MGRSTQSTALNDLLPACRRGDEEAFMEAYRQIGGSLYGTALRIVGRPQDAEDVVQETFVRLFEKAGTIGDGALGAWLHRVAVNRSLDRLRARRRQREDALDGSEASDGGSIGAVERPAGAQRIDLTRAVARLPERARLVFLLHDLEGYRHREVGEALGISEGTSKGQLFRARRILRRLLDGEAEVYA